MKIEFAQSNEYLTTHSGLTVIGALLSKTNLRQKLDQTVLTGVKSPAISHGDVMTSYLGLLCQGKSDFDHIEPFRNDDAFAISLHIKDVPSSPTLRQRLDMAGQSNWNTILLQESTQLLKRLEVELTPVKATLPGGKEGEWIPLDIDVSPFDNSNSKKEGVSYTCKGHEGYSPIFAYLGGEGYAVHGELREGKTHCQSELLNF